MMNPYKRHPLRLKKSKKRGGILNFPLGALKRARQYRDDFADLLAPRKRSRSGFAPRVGSLTGVMTARPEKGLSLKRERIPFQSVIMDDFLAMYPRLYCGLWPSN